VAHGSRQSALSVEEPHQQPLDGNTAWVALQQLNFSWGSKLDGHPRHLQRACHPFAYM
jgi:hypothetical protein